MSEQKPEAVWVFPEEPKNRGGRIALVVGLVVAALVAAGVVVLFLIPHGDGAPTPTPSPTTSATSTPKPTASPRPRPPRSRPTCRPRRSRRRPRSPTPRSLSSAAWCSLAWTTRRPVWTWLRTRAATPRCRSWIRCRTMRRTWRASPLRLRSPRRGATASRPTPRSCRLCARRSPEDPTHPRLADARAALGQLRALVGL